MKALVYTGPKTLVVRDEPEPQANEDVIVRVDVCGICGSDMHVYLGHDTLGLRRKSLAMKRQASSCLARSAGGASRSIRSSRAASATCAVAAARTSVAPARSCRARHVRRICRTGQGPERNLSAVPDELVDGDGSVGRALAVGYHAVNLGERAMRLPLAAAQVVVIGGGRDRSRRRRRCCNRAARRTF